jgi:hypothetical protein
LGHSSGAVKCIYAVAHEPTNRPACLVAVSPPRLSYSWFCSSSQGRKFLETYAQAEQFVQSGQPAALLDVILPLPIVIAAAGYVEKYGPEERYNYLRLARTLTCPTLVTLGSQEMENNMAFQGAAEAAAELAVRNRHLHVETIAGADHFYTGRRKELVERVEAWLRRVLPNSPVE